MSGKLKIALPIIVEGRYDAIKLKSIADANIITTDGFGIFNAAEKRALLRRLAETGPVIVLTDPDGAGLLSRSQSSGILPPDRVIHLYVPEREGKEKRKKAPSKSGLVGVEGSDADLLRELLAPYADDASGSGSERASVTKSDLYADGLSGADGSAEKRAALARELGLPSNMSANALVAAINMICTPGEYRVAVDKINHQGENDVKEG